MEQVYQCLLRTVPQNVAHSELLDETRKRINAIKALPNPVISDAEVVLYTIGDNTPGNAQGFAQRDSNGRKWGKTLSDYKTHPDRQQLEAMNSIRQIMQFSTVDVTSETQINPAKHRIYDNYYGAKSANGYRSGGANPLYKVTFQIKSVEKI